jgi:hypothetical protein
VSCSRYRRSTEVSGLLTGFPSVFVRSPDRTTWRPLLSTNDPLGSGGLRLIAEKRPEVIPLEGRRELRLLSALTL